MTKVKIYSTPTCPYCHQAKDWLRQNKIPFQDFNVLEDEKARDHILSKTGNSSVPQFEINGEFIIGFDKTALEKALLKKSHR